jgi:hypothetical protein
METNLVNDSGRSCFSHFNAISFKDRLYCRSDELFWHKQQLFKLLLTQ